MLKKISLAILGMILSGFASAGMMGSLLPCTPGDVTVPCEGRAWDIGAQALYFRPAYSNGLGYEFDLERGFKRVIPRWGFGYRIQGSYHFHTGNDVTMTFIQYGNKSDRGGYAGDIPFALASEPFILRLENKFDQVNLVLGQLTDISPWKKIRFYGGLQFAKIRVDNKNSFLEIPAALIRRSVSSLDQFRDTDFLGLGPVIGIDYSFNFLQCLSVTGNAATSLLYGVNRFVTGFVSGPSNVVNEVESKSYRTVIPGIETKLGLRYHHGWRWGMLNVEGGFQAIHYFDVLQRRRTFAITKRNDISNFGLYGPYLGVALIAI